MDRFVSDLESRLMFSNLIISFILLYSLFGGQIYKACPYLALFLFLLLPGGPGMNGLLSVSASAAGVMEEASRSTANSSPSFRPSVISIMFPLVEPTVTALLASCSCPFFDPYETFPGRGFLAGFGDDVA